VEELPVPDDLSQPVPVQARPVAGKGRITRVVTTYYQSMTKGEGPICQNFRQSRPCHSEERPYLRTMKIGEAWQALDLGWLKGAALALLEVRNAAETATLAPDGNHRTKAPAVEVRMDGGPPFAFLAPGDLASFVPSAPSLLQVRCRAGTTRVALAAYPA
jgi:hypothetical protein